MSEWLSGLMRIEHISGKEERPGARRRHIYKNKDGEFILDERIISLEKNREYASTISNKMMTSQVTHVFEEHNGVTKIVSTYQITFNHFFLAVTAHFSKKIFQQRQQKDLEKLKNILEKNLS
jgi:hypothetical protein